MGKQVTITKLVYLISINHISYVLSFFSDTLYKEDLARLIPNYISKKSFNNHVLAVYLRDYLRNTYPSQYWVVTVYDPVKSNSLHSFFGWRNSIDFKIRFRGINYVVTRFPKHPTRYPKVPISVVVGSISGSDPEAIRDSILDNFSDRELSVSSILVLKRSWWEGQGRGYRRKVSMGYSVQPHIPTKNYYIKKFRNVVVIVVAPY